LHLLHHQIDDAEHPTRARPMYPPHSLSDTINAKHGDWVQAFAIAGTDVVPPTSKAINQRLAMVLEADLALPELSGILKAIRPRRLQEACALWKTGTRCHTDGLNILVNYEPSGRTTTLGKPIENALLGHGVATTIDWLPTHLAAVMEGLRQEA